MPRLSLTLLGPPRATLDDQVVVGFKSDKVRALLAYLAVEGARPHRRESLAATFWPESRNQTAAARLRDVLSNLRRVIGDPQASVPFVLTTDDTIRFNTAADYTLDVVDFESRIAAGGLDAGRAGSQGAIPPFSAAWADILQSALALYRGPFLEGFSLRDSAPFEEWALLQRERCAGLMLAALRWLSGYYQECGDYVRAQAYVRRQLELEPWDEEAHRCLMRLLALDGQRGAALAQYQTCRRLLALELDVEPTGETVALYESICAGKLERMSVTVSQQLSESPRRLLSRSAAPPSGTPGLPSPFVGREDTLAWLGHHLDAALAGDGRAIFVRGDAGSGKTVLMAEFARRAMAGHEGLLAASGRCNAYGDMGDPYLPFREIVQLLTGDIEAPRAAGAVMEEHARRLWAALPQAAAALLEAAPDLVGRFVPGDAAMLRLLPVAAFTDRSHAAAVRERLEALAKGRPETRGSGSLQQVDFFAQLSAFLLALARVQPLLLFLDDMQWADTGSLSLLFHLGRRLVGTRILLAVAYRGEEVASGEEAGRHPLVAVVNELRRVYGDVELDLNQADGRHFVAALLDSEPNRLDGAFRDTLFNHTGGNALFTVELMQGLCERGELAKDATGAWVETATINWNRLPARVEAVMAERVGRLTPETQAILEAASVEGEEFTAEAVARAAGCSEAEAIGKLGGLLADLGLVRAASVVRLPPRDEGSPGAATARRLSRYRFAHHLWQRYVYQRIDEAQQAQLHESIAHALEDLTEGQLAAREVLAGKLAWHFEQGGLPEQALPYLLQAAERARRLAANGQALAHLRHGLDLLRTLPESRARSEIEVKFQLALCASLQLQAGLATEGERRDAARRAHALTQQLAGAPRLLAALALHVLWRYEYRRGEYGLARRKAEEILALARQCANVQMAAMAHAALARTNLVMGSFTACLEHAEQVLVGYHPDEHEAVRAVTGWDVAVGALGSAGLALVFLGLPDQAICRADQAVRLARTLDSAYSLSDALLHSALIRLERREPEAARPYLEEAVACARAHHLTYHQAWVSLLEGGIRAGRGEFEAAVASVTNYRQMAEGMDFVVSGGAHLMALAESLVGAGHTQAALAAVEDGLALAVRTGERCLESDLVRLKGELLGSEEALLQAIGIARRQGALVLELRATVSLARTLRCQGRRESAYQHLAAVYGRFTEGFDAPDLREAQTLLRELSEANIRNNAQLIPSFRTG